jgi:hypothetical protein
MHRCVHGWLGEGRGLAWAYESGSANFCKGFEPQGSGRSLIPSAAEPSGVTAAGFQPGRFIWHGGSTRLRRVVSVVPPETSTFHPLPTKRCGARWWNEVVAATATTARGTRALPPLQLYRSESGDVRQPQPLRGSARIRRWSGWAKHGRGLPHSKPLARALEGLVGRAVLSAPVASLRMAFRHSVGPVACRHGLAARATSFNLGVWLQPTRPLPSATTLPSQ